MATPRQRADVRTQLNAIQLQEIGDFIALLEILVKQVGGNLTTNQLLILAVVWEADLKGISLAVSDIAGLCNLPSSIAGLCNLPSSTASSTIARLGDFTTYGMGLISLQTDRLDRRKKLVRPSRQLAELARSIAQGHAAYLERTNRAANRRNKG